MFHSIKQHLQNQSLVNSFLNLKKHFKKTLFSYELDNENKTDVYEKTPKNATETENTRKEIG